MPIAISPVPYPVPSTGWTVFTPSPDSRVVYCSTSGNDANSGLSPSRPKQTLLAARNLLRPGMPDWLLLKKGDTWEDENFGNMEVAGILLRGRSATEPMLISSYGTGARPRINTGDTPVIDITSFQPFLYCAIVGIHMNADTYDGVSGGSTAIRVTNASMQYVLVEDCKIENWFRAISFGQATELKIRRNVICDIRRANTQIHGIYISSASTVLVEGNYFDNMQFAAPNVLSPAATTEEDTSGVSFRDNIFTRCGSDAISMRGGGTATRNFIYQAGCGIRFGIHQTLVPSVIQGIPASASDNIILDTHGLSTERAGMFFRNILGGTIQGNIIARCDDTGGQSFYLHGDGWRVRNLGFHLNVCYGFKGPVRVNGTQSTHVQNVLFDTTQVQEPGNAPIFDAQSDAVCLGFSSGQNEFWGAGAETTWFEVGASTGNLAFYKTKVQGDSTSTANQVAYADTDRDLADYMAFLGTGTTIQDFIDACRAQEREVWNQELEASAILEYFRLAFT